jgi:hypothetical protein
MLRNNGTLLSLRGTKQSLVIVIIGFTEVSISTLLFHHYIINHTVGFCFC